MFKVFPFYLQMPKDRRYNIAKKLIFAGALATFEELLDAVPKTTVARDMGMHLQTFDKYIANPLLFSFEDAFKLARLIECDPQAVVNLIYKECLAGQKGRRKK